jgi:hypothetical protein
MLRCATPFPGFRRGRLIAAYAKSTPHSSGLACLACGLFTKPSYYTIFLDYSRIRQSITFDLKGDRYIVEWIDFLKTSPQIDSPLNWLTYR